MSLYMYNNRGGLLHIFNVFVKFRFNVNKNCRNLKNLSRESLNSNLSIIQTMYLLHNKVQNEVDLI